MKKKSRCGIKTVFSAKDDDFLKKNYLTMTNVEMANHIGVTLTVLRNRTRVLGLRKVELEYWTNEQILFLRNNYAKMGNVEIAEELNRNYPRKKAWKECHITKKLFCLGLVRTKDEVESILERNKLQKRYDLTNARRCYQKIRLQLPDDYVIRASLRIYDKRLIARTKRDCPMLVKLARERILKYRSENDKQSCY